MKLISFYQIRTDSGLRYSQVHGSHTREEAILEYHRLQWFQDRPLRLYEISVLGDERDITPEGFRS
jgi:hypothetical protein